MSRRSSISAIQSLHLSAVFRASIDYQSMNFLCSTTYVALKLIEQLLQMPSRNAPKMQVSRCKTTCSVIKHKIMQKNSKTIGNTAETLIKSRRKFMILSIQFLLSVVRNRIPLSNGSHFSTVWTFKIAGLSTGVGEETTPAIKRSQNVKYYHWTLWTHFSIFPLLWASTKTEKVHATN